MHWIVAPLFQLCQKINSVQQKAELLRKINFCKNCWSEALIIFLSSPRIILCRGLWHPPTQRRRGGGAPRCGTTLIAALDQPSTIPALPALPAPSPAMKKLSPGDPCPGKPRGQARNYWSFAATDHIWWSHTEIGRGVGWSVSACIRSWLHAPLSLKSPRKPLFLIPCLGHVSYLILPAWI